MWTLKSDFDNYRFIFIIWPSNLETWRKKARPIKKTFKRLIKTIAKFDDVLVAINDFDKIPFKYKNVKFIRLSSNDSWARDTSPLILKSKNNADLQKGIAFAFDAYNNLYQDFEHDREIAGKICKYLNIDCEKLDIILEGGGIVCNGNGVAIMTQELLQNRKNTLSEIEVKKLLKNQLGLNKLVLLKKGLCFDETAGHADEILAFCGEKEVALAWTDDLDNPNYQRCRENLEILNKELPDFIIHKIILPNPLTRKSCEIIEGNKKLRGKEIPVAISYINFLYGKDYIILPQFGVCEDKIAFQQFKKIFPNKKIIPFYSREIALGGGGIHCITKNL